MYQKSSNLCYLQTTQNLYSDSNLKNLNNVVNNELDELNTWFIINNLSLNVSKTNYILFGNRKVHSDLDIKIHNDKTKLLGLVKKNSLEFGLMKNLIWKNHVECVKRNLSRVVGIMYRARHWKPTNILLLTVFTSTYLLLWNLGNCIHFYHTLYWNIT